MKKLFLLIFVILILFGCSNDKANSITEEIDSKNQSVEIVNVNDQVFEIIPTYSYYLDYISEQQSSDTNKDESFYDTVIAPISNEIYGNKFSLNGNIHFSTPRSISELNEYINQLNEMHSEIIHILKEGLKDSTDILSGGDYKIYLIPYNPDESSSYMEGVAGFADEGIIALQIDPNHYTKDSLRSTLAHEYHHAVYIEFSDYKTRYHHLLDRVIMEGKADIFAKTVYPSYTVPWIEPLSPDTSEIVWDYIKEHKYSYKIEDIINLHRGSVTDGLPQWSNYKISYQIMESYLSQNPNKSVEEWTFIPAMEIIDDTEYSLK